MENVKMSDEKIISCDFSNLFADAVGLSNGIAIEDLDLYSSEIQKAFVALDSVRKGAIQPHGEKALFMQLPYQSESFLQRIIEWSSSIRQNYKNVIWLGIGGSYLGNKALQEALNSPYYNEDSSSRSGNPKIYFAGHNLDPANLKALLNVVDVKESKIIIVSKSGGTVEPMSHFAVILDELKRRNGDISSQVTAVTDPSSGVLRELCEVYGWDSFDIPQGVGGRWCVLSSVGLLSASLAGVDIRALLDGAKVMDEVTQQNDIVTNLPARYAFIHWCLYKKYSKNIGVLMPYSLSLKSFGEWYVQLLSESLGKKLNRSGALVREGRTPSPAVGTTDMHSQTQQHSEGALSRVITFVDIEDYQNKSLTIPDFFGNHPQLSSIGNKKMEDLLKMALLANQQSLANEGCPTCRIILPRLDAYSLGQLFYFFEYATAFEAELLNLNAYDQPGVEGYKSIMKSMIKEHSQKAKLL